MDAWAFDSLLTFLEKELEKLSGEEPLDLEQIEKLETTIETLKEYSDVF